MTDRLEQLLALVPPGVTPEDVIDLVDGRLPKGREATVIDAIAWQPRLGALVKQMREDRDGLVAMGPVHAPVGLLSGIEARLQAEALRELAQAESETTTAIRVSTYEHASPSVLRTFVESIWARRLATAASLAIVAGLSALGVRELVRSGTLQWPYGTAQRTPDSTTPIVPDGGPRVVPIPTEIVNATPGDGVKTPDAAPTTPASPAPMTIAQAQTLAREGRLALVVRSLDRAGATAATRHIETIARAAGVGRDGPWAVLNAETLAPAYAAMLQPIVDVPGLPVPSAPSSPNSPTVASGDPNDAQARPIGSTDAPGVTVPKLGVRAMYTVDIVPDERAIEGLFRSLSTGDGSVHVAFRALPEPMFVELSAQPKDVLWWTASPTNWVKTRRVPVTIESVE